LWEGELPAKVFLFKSSFLNREIKMIEDVIFLGAGASRAEGAPLQAELFRDYFKLCKPDSMSKEGEITLYRRMRKFFKDFFGINIANGDLNHTSFPTFEEALGVLEIAIKKEESFKGWISDSDSADIKIQRYRQSLIYLISTVLERALQGKAHYHRRLIQRLLKQRKLNKTAFISVNYEILIDNALMESGFDIDYGVPTIKHPNRYSDYLRMPDREPIRLYKLHGSLNWLYCPTCISLTITPFRKSGSQLIQKSEQCRECKGKVVPIIVPPTYFKVMSNHFLEQIWYKSDELLRTAKRIIFCGYSFPEADIHIKYLLKRAELYNRNGFEVYVINQHPAKPKEASENEAKRYERFFKNKHAVQYLNGAFEQFCESGELNMLKYIFPSK
jgi:NAD-dependent SIR2 family protein deacetylase